MPARLLFSDVDGTLLGADGQYAMSAAELASAAPRLDIVLASSRTVLELSRNQRDLGIAGPVVAENGAVMAWPAAAALSDVGALETIDARSWQVVLIGASAEPLRRVVREAAQQLGTEYIDQADVEPMLGRRCSVLLRPVPGRDFGSLAGLVTTLRERGLSVASGGSWLAVTGGADKGDGVRAVLACWLRLGHRHAVVAAAGDADNDRALLLAADRRFVIARPDGSWHPALCALPGVECVPTTGVAGWRDVVHRLTTAQEV
ncbi:MAG: HAD hydrolase family protein [Gemmatimonadota bacterium]